MGKNVIITLASNYTFRDLKVFVVSLNNTGFDGVLFLIVNSEIEIPREGLKYEIKQLTVKELKFDSVKYKIGLRERFKTIQRKTVTTKLLNELQSTDFKDEKLLMGLSEFYHCQISRYALYLTILLKGDYENVFLTDSRDVYFQADPFANVKKGLHLFQENKIFSIKDRWYNNQWVKICTGFLNYLKIRNKGIFCSGTILGDRDSMVSFLRLFLFSILKKNLPFDIKGLDQGLFNVLIHNGQMDNFEIHDDQKHVLTLSAMDKSEFTFDQDLIYNAAGFAPSVVHQYDRHESLLSFINNKL